MEKEEAICQHIFKQRVEYADDWDLGLSRRPSNVESYVERLSRCLRVDQSRDSIPWVITIESASDEAFGRD